MRIYLYQIDQYYGYKGCVPYIMDVNKMRPCGGMVLADASVSFAMPEDPTNPQRLQVTDSHQHVALLSSDGKFDPDSTFCEASLLEDNWSEYEFQVERGGGEDFTLSDARWARFADGYEGFIVGARGGDDMIYTAMGDTVLLNIDELTFEHPEFKELFDRFETALDSGEEIFEMPEERKINALLVKPGEYPEKVEVGASLSSLQNAVNGNIEAVYPFDDPVAIICNEEGKFNGMRLNRAALDANGAIYDIYAGPFLVVGLTEDDFGSLSPKLMEKYEKKFHQPEMFVRNGTEIYVLPMSEESAEGKRESVVEKMKNTEPRSETRSTSPSHKNKEEPEL